MVIVITTALISVLIIKEEKKFFTKAFLEEHISQARLLAHEIVEPLLYEDFYTIYTIFKNVIKNDPHISWIILEDKDGKPLFHYPKIEEIQEKDVFEISIEIKTEELGRLGTLKMGLRKDLLLSRLQATESKLLLLIGIIVLTGILAALWMIRRVAKPILVLNQAAREIGKGHFGKTIKVKAVGEIAELVESFNRMSLQLKELVEEIKRTHERMARSERLYALGQFAAGVAHEIKNPLTSISLSIELLKMGKARPETFEIIEKEIKRIDRLVKNFLEFARSQRQDLKFVETQVNSILEETLKLIGFQARKNKIEIHTEFADLPAIQSSPEALKQIFLNVILNAIQAMEGGGELRVKTALKDDDHVVITIKDTGPGIPKEILNRVFDPFFTTKPDGTGMGLAITYNLVKSLGGEIEIYSEEGKGTRVEIILPISPKSS
ncbi:sensor histidine kinase [Thermosulfurimonas dismutans]|uniref:sensor histidine kinase n=1 Tax=Thermosulfurimonas dismutans TaxID=999894 RepID=UPI00137B8EEC|nr:sensor histidine kinase [Thermosulfurimonas dismutans]